MNHDFNAEILNQVAHRPWKLPTRRWVMTQSWHDLLFAHWPVDPSVIRARVPAAFELDLFQAHAWVGIVPFHMTNVAFRGVPSFPWVSRFPELNVRTYVRVGGRPGVYFFSLDAGSVLAVLAARTLLNLPYCAASIAVAPGGSGVAYRSVRRGGVAAEFDAVYQPCGAAFTAGEGSLAHFLTERYCLYHLSRRGVPYRLEIHHPPWQLQSAEATFRRNTMAAVNQIGLRDEEPVLHFVRRQDMVAWLPTRVS